LRPDGGYILELASVASDGQAVVNYLNPRPIHVARAEASTDAHGLLLRVELQDVGYPGCVYTLNYDKAGDRLIGTYFQAALRETFQVEFTRLE
jgi:hypothetical protein